MTDNTTIRSGTSKQPQQVGVLPYPAMLTLSETPEIKNVLCYVIKHYGASGISATITRRKIKDDVDINVIFGDWDGNTIDINSGELKQACLHFMANHSKQFIEMMRIINIPNAQFYLAVGKDSLILTDIRFSASKFSGPGMIRDLFGKLIKTQEVVKIEPVVDKTIDAIEKGHGSYSGDLILKPSRFRTVERPNATKPLYVAIRR